MPVDGWREAYDGLFADAAAALANVPALDLQAEFITHRFTSTSREVLLDWYPGSPLEMDKAARVRKTTRFGSTKHVYPAATMRELRCFLERHSPAGCPRHAFSTGPDALALGRPILAVVRLAGCCRSPPMPGCDSQPGAGPVAMAPAPLRRWAFSLRTCWMLSVSAIQLTRATFQLCEQLIAR